ncbi:helix-turn-helix transcriptional regulator (plasmid) [Lactococcus sp. LG1074]|uniref:XRE family transcriptional regulator n=1 Tax=Lactococcus TaxID=1357 RepID=UPI001A905216|nr:MULTISPECIES: XRE family transcriptional regulator [Lactococcus]QSR03139.1 helix-turn-helix transcriptional regulator [Lactococcus sp. LG1074]QUW40347.1 Transcriptional regulator, Cro/CI family [Lactococcus garvieae]
MELSERLKNLREEGNYSQVFMADILDVSQGAYQKWESGARFPKIEQQKKLAEFFDVSISYLIGETNIKKATRIMDIMDKLSEPNQEETISFAQRKLEEQEEENNIIQIHSSLVPYEVEEEQALSAGYGEGYTNTYTKETVYWNKDIAYDRAIRIKGESMEPEYHYGEIALIKYQECIDYPGQVCAVDDVERGKAYIKCVSKTENGLLLESINDLEDKEGNRLFPNIFIPFEENPRIIGVVKEHFLPIEI